MQPQTHPHQLPPIAGEFLKAVLGNELERWLKGASEYSNVKE